MSARSGKECAAMETQFNYIFRCVTFRTMSVPSFNSFCSKLIEIVSLFFRLEVKLSQIGSRR